MSVSRSCIFIQTTEDDWYIVLGMHEGARLTRSEAIAWGPLSSFEECENVLDQFPNPGGWITIDLQDATRYLDHNTEVAALIDEPWNPYTMQRWNP